MAKGTVQPVYLSKAVTTAGSEIQLSTTELLVYSFIIEAKPANTGYIYIGDSTVSSTAGIRLAAGGSFSSSDVRLGGNYSAEFDLSDWYIDCSVNGEGVNIIYYLKKS